MTKKQTAAPVQFTTRREAGIQARVLTKKKGEFRMGWEAASRPEVLDTITAFDEAEINATAQALLDRFSA